MNRIRHLALLACLLVPMVGVADDRIRSERLPLESGQAPVPVTGSLVGYESVDYLVSGRAGQVLTVTLQTDHGANYFNVIPPDADNEAVFIGSTQGARYEGRLDLDGDWKLRIYLMRSAARRGETAHYTLIASLDGYADPSAAREANDFGPREWDGRGKLGCARGGQPMQTAACEFKVLRYRPNATIFVRAPGTGTVRILYFEAGDWSTDSAEPVHNSRRSDLWTLVVGDEAYELPESVLTGG